MKHEHDWLRVRAVVTVINDPDAHKKDGTYNAVCACGAKAWLHWPEPRFKT